jgi:acyl-CoA synthetase (AMP-forming)/AMP-acid ligase II
MTAPTAEGKSRAASGSPASCAKGLGLPDEKWGELFVAVLQARLGVELDAGEVQAFVRERIGSVKAPKQVEVWADLPRSKIGKVLKPDIRARMLRT